MTELKLRPPEPVATVPCSDAVRPPAWSPGCVEGAPAHQKHQRIMLSKRNPLAFRPTLCFHVPFKD